MLLAIEARASQTLSTFSSTEHNPKQNKTVIKIILKRKRCQAWQREKSPGFGTGGQRHPPKGTLHLPGTKQAAISQCPEPPCSRHPGRLPGFMVLHSTRISKSGTTMFFAIKEALLNVTKTMNPDPQAATGHTIAAYG